MSSPLSFPTHWCNFVFDYPEYAVRDSLSFPVLNENYSRRVSIVPQQPLSLAKQSNNTSEADIPIPLPVRAFYQLYRPTPLRRAAQLGERLGVNARIYYKFEGANISGSHKLNTALAQAYYYSQAGVKHLVTGTGAGQWGTAIAYACQQFGLECTVFMVGASLRQKPQRAKMMEMFGATVYGSPSTITQVGQDAIKRDPERVGTLAFATGEALEFSRPASGRGLLWAAVKTVSYFIRLSLASRRPSRCWRSASFPITSSLVWAREAILAAWVSHSCALQGDWSLRAFACGRAGSLSEVNSWEIRV